MTGRLRRILHRVAGATGTFLLCLLTSEASMASAPPPPAAGDVWREECGACHIAYPARLLPIGSWRAVLERLDRHFGVDASLEPARRDAVLAYLAANSAPAGEPATGGGTPRITRLRWFEREHAELPRDAWQRPSVRSPANCGACHPAAERGVFDENGVKVPK